MMSGMMFALIAAVAASFFVDLLGFVFRTLPNFRQTVTRFLSPEGLLVGLTITPSMRDS
jgi:hypothetical protein